MHKQLSLLKKRLVDLPSEDTASAGVNMANFCIRDSLQTRIELLTEMYGDEQELDKIYTNADYASFCTEFTDSLVIVISEDMNRLSNDLYGRSFRRQAKWFLNEFQPLRDWLKRTSLGVTYDS